MDGQMVVRRETLHLFRSKFLYENTCYEHLQILELWLGADRTLVFALPWRRLRRYVRNSGDPRAAEGTAALMVWWGRTGWCSPTKVWMGSSPDPDQFSAPNPKIFSSQYSAFKVRLPNPRVRRSFTITCSCESGGYRRRFPSYESAGAKLRNSIQKRKSRTCTVTTSHDEINRWLNRSTADLEMMLTNEPTARIPTPEFPGSMRLSDAMGSLPALECLWMNPWIARGVLAYLASTQAQESNPASDAEPGKILHESRNGEMATTGEVPFARYYGSVDATPLFVLLASEYFRRTADREFIQSIQSNIDRALEWIDRYGDADGDGFVEYKRKSAEGLVQQGWKDSGDSVFYSDGRLVEGPVALCEVQAYVFGAKRGAAELARVFGQSQRADKLAGEAERLRQRFEEAFWCDDLGTYVLALDGKKQPCRVRTSNAGHCLYIGIASSEHASRLAQTLLAADSFSGWGIRTLSSLEVRYNPVSYHNGSVWPHDNALIAAGFARYGFRESALKIAAALFDVSRFVDLQRLPELFCGFERQPGDGPTLYPVACSPQSWAIASVFLLVQALLGIEVSPLDSPAIRLQQPVLPRALEYVQIKGLTLDHASVDLRLRPGINGATVDIEGQSGDVKVAVDR